MPRALARLAAVTPMLGAALAFAACHARTERASALVGASSASESATTPADAAPARSASPRRAPAPPAPSWRADGLHPEALGPFATSDGSEACARCHAEIAREWRGSLHRRAYEDPYFVAAYAIERTAFCRGCHAPLARGSEPDARARAEGISCAICHVRGDAIVGVGPATRAGPHRVIADAALASPAACAGCHEFPFPVRLADEPEGAVPHMQRTLEEWRASEPASRGVGCGACHMPSVIGPQGKRHHSHAFAGVEPALLRAALRVEASVARDGDEIVVTLALTAARVGHAVPTGDLFRALQLELAIGGRVRDRARLTRVFREVVGAGAGGTTVVVRREERDDRVPPGGTRTVRLRARAAAGERLSWSLAHLRAPPAIAAIDHVDVGATEIARGEIEAP
jgi:hypothetical protein